MKKIILLFIFINSLVPLSINSLNPKIKFGAGILTGLGLIANGLYKLMNISFEEGVRRGSNKFLFSFEEILWKNIRDLEDEIRKKQIIDCMLASKNEMQEKESVKLASKSKKVDKMLNQAILFLSIGFLLTKYSNDRF